MKLTCIKCGEQRPVYRLPLRKRSKKDIRRWKNDKGRDGDAKEKAVR